MRFLDRTKLGQLSWRELPRSLRVSILTVLVGVTLCALVVPLSAQTPERPVRIEEVVVGWSGIVALLGLAVNWGLKLGEERSQAKQREKEEAAEAERRKTLDEKLDRMEEKKVDRRELVEALRRLGAMHKDLQATNQRLDRYMERQGE